MFKEKSVEEEAPDNKHLSPPSLEQLGPRLSVTNHICISSYIEAQSLKSDHQMHEATSTQQNHIISAFLDIQLLGHVLM